MVSITSGGIRTPVALQYLIAERILPPDPGEDLYQWTTYSIDEDGNDVDEEILVTKRCVVWSQGIFIRNIFHFQLEDEDVQQALLTSFPASGTTESQEGQAVGDEARKAAPPYPTQRRRPYGQTPPARLIQRHNQSAPGASRALVVLLTSKAHVYFPHGSSHIVDLPFEIEQAFPAPRGIILQRKAPAHSLLSSGPGEIAAPPNSFLSSRMQASYSPSQNSILGQNLRFPQLPQPVSLNRNDAKLDSLFREVIDTSKYSTEDDFASLYSLTSPLSDVGVVTCVAQSQNLRLSGKKTPYSSIEFQSLEPAEQLVYLSPYDELGKNQTNQRGALTIAVTFNRDIDTLTVWHAWYVDEKSLASLLKHRAAQKAAKAWRRASFLNASIGTGTATPTARNREGVRESFTSAGPTRLTGEQGLSNASTSYTRQASRQHEEDAMASQMDPDYQPGGSQQISREGRRISSLNTDVRTSQHSAGPNLTSFGGRRNASFGGPSERRSFGHRKSRGSTPGSVFGRSIDHEYDLMELDSDSEIDASGHDESVLRQIRATFEAAGADGIFGGLDGGLKREVIVRKLHVSTLDAESGLEQATNKIKILTKKDTANNGHESDEDKLSIYIWNKDTGNLHQVQILIRYRALWPESTTSQLVAIPSFTKEIYRGKSPDVTKVRDRDIEAVLLDSRGILLSSDQATAYPVPKLSRMPVRELLHLSSHGKPDHEKHVSHRVLPAPDASASGQQNGSTWSHGKGGDYTAQLRPKDNQVFALLKLCQAILPTHLTTVMISGWQISHSWFFNRREMLETTAVDIESMALVSTIFLFAVSHLNQKDRMDIKKAAMMPESQQETVSLQLTKQLDAARLFGQAAWSSMQQDKSQNESFAVVPGHLNNASQRRDQLLPVAAAAAIDILEDKALRLVLPNFRDMDVELVKKLMLALHIAREEEKLTSLSNLRKDIILAPVIAQLGYWANVPEWSFRDGGYYSSEGASEYEWAFAGGRVPNSSHVPIMGAPVGFYQWFDHSLRNCSTESYPSLATVGARDFATSDPTLSDRKLVPRLTALSNLMSSTNGLAALPEPTVQLMVQHGVTSRMLETLPHGVAAPLRNAMSKCESQPPTTWPTSMLEFVARDDLVFNATDFAPSYSQLQISAHDARDGATICHTLEHKTHSSKTKEASRHSVSQLIFNEDRRLVEATSLMRFNSVQIAECAKQPDWSDAVHFDRQRRVQYFATIRMIALPPGDALIHFDSQTPLLTEKYHLPGFNASCLMQPMGHTLTTDRSGLTEEKVNWAYFHAGASMGLRISRTMKGIDTSWIAFNKPAELTNRHAGLLLALGLNGHLKSLAKWLAFKYLTPKHTITSVGLLLGLSASHIGSMDGLITRMLSVHITRMLPPGAAELNVSPTTQTAGLMGIGLLYYDTQHRRMSEIMLSEIENLELEDLDSGPNSLRDEAYRLSAGFAFGLINLGKGSELHGLHGMRISERLLAIAVGPRPVGAVHIFDRATAGAIVAIALVYMKTGDQSVAQKIDVPNTEAQFEHVRPDMLLLRVMAKHLILWDEISVKDVYRSTLDVSASNWIQTNLPSCFADRLQSIDEMCGRYRLTSTDVPFLNIVTGLAWALGLKYAGSANITARDEILHVLEHFLQVGADAYYYDAKMARSTLRRCVDVLALASATVMAGTGDLQTFRHLRRLHGRTDWETPYGSHLAAHMAIGVLFLGGGTYTFTTSNFAIAALVCAFYPIFPSEVNSNEVHLQAFRHFWVFAAEARCIVIEDSDTQRPVSIPIKVKMKHDPLTGQEEIRSMTAPCLLPEVDRIATLETDDHMYWRVKLDFEANPQHLAAFRRNPRILVRRCPASEAHQSTFSATLGALSKEQYSPVASGLITSSRLVGPVAVDPFQTIFHLPALDHLNKSLRELILPPDPLSSISTSARGTVVDDQLALERAFQSVRRDDLWGLRVLLAWAARDRHDEVHHLTNSSWIHKDIIEGLQAMVEEQQRNTQ